MRFSASILAVAASVAGAGGVRAQASPALTAEARAALAREMRTSLREELLAPWYPRAVDWQAGGFLSQFDSAWAPTGAQQKMIVSQARHVWTNARAAEFFRDTSYLPAARHGFAFLRDVMWDRGRGGFFWLVTREGAPVPEADGRNEANGRLIKQAYGQAFGIYALAGYYAVTRDSAALELAQRAFHWLDSHAHDARQLGYFNYMEADGTPLREGYAGTPPKDQNSSIHLLEALTELYRIWPDPQLRARLAEMQHVVRDIIVVEPAHLTLFSAADWTPVSYRDSSAAVREAHHYFDHVSFGHDIETAYLLLEASQALGLEHDTLTERVAKELADHALLGWDEERGGLFDAGYYFRDRPGLTIVRRSKAWWAQAETLNTLSLLAARYPDDPRRYGEKLLRQWRYIGANLVDHEHGGWYEGGLDQEPERRSGLKGHIWKAAYHESRAMMNVVRRLEGER